METRADKANKMDQSGRVLTTFLAAILMQVSDANSWAEWWAYDQGISGPHFWGLLNPRWVLCNKGHNQSPVNIDPKTLLFDPSLSPLEVNGMAVSGELINQGHSLILEIDLASHWSPGVNITGGPLSYVYSQDGSEHTVDGTGFTAEIQMLAYNSDLYSNMTAAMTLPRGLVCVSILIKVSNETHPHFERIHRAMNETIYKGNRKHVAYLNLRRLLPDTDHYVTYEGSLTHPACHETVTWIIYNKPIFISHSQLAGLRRLKQDTVYNPVLLMAGNIRPLQAMNQRTVRTNINFLTIIFFNKELEKTSLNDGTFDKQHAVSFALCWSDALADTWKQVLQTKSVFTTQSNTKNVFRPSIGNLHATSSSAETKLAILLPQIFIHEVG